MTSSGFIVPADGGEPVPGAAGSLLASAADTGGAFSLLLSRAPAGDHVPRHVHDTVDEAFYILDGQYRIHCDDQTWTAAVGDFIFLPHGVLHSYDVAAHVDLWWRARPLPPRRLFRRPAAAAVSSPSPGSPGTTTPNTARAPPSPRLWRVRQSATVSPAQTTHHQHSRSPRMRPTNAWHAPTQ